MVLIAGAAYVAREHEQAGLDGRTRCARVCLLNKIAPACEASGGSSPAEPSAP